MAREHWERVGIRGLLPSACLISMVAVSIPIVPVYGVQAPSDPPPREAAVSAEPDPAADQETATGGGEDQEREWFTEEDGTRYYLMEIPKYEGYYKWVDDNHVRIKGGVVLTVESHDEDSFMVKIYERPEGQSGGAGQGAAAEAPTGSIPDVDLNSSDRIRFEPFDDGLPRRRQWRNGFSLADVNGDGHLDIIHGPPRKGGETPAIFLGDGDGRWSIWGEADFGDASLDYGDTAVADFNQDGNLDVAFAVHLRGLKAFVGDGRGGFTEWSEGLPFRAAGGGLGASSFSSRVVEAVDWNRDGLPDLLTLGEGPRMGRGGEEGRPRTYASASGPVIFLNQGDGSWDAVVRELEAGDRKHYGDTLTVADFNGDGRSDFVVGTSARGARDILHLATEDESVWEKVAIPNLPGGGAAFRGLAAGDFDRDGKTDLAVGYSSRPSGVWRTGVDVMMAADDGWERVPLLFETTDRGIWALASGDLDGDGNEDVAAFDGLGEAVVYLGRGDGTFTLEKSGELEGVSATCRAYHAAIRDLDGDGRGELLVGFAGEPGSEKLFGTTRCSHGGALQAWTPIPMSEAGADGSLGEAPPSADDDQEPQQRR